MEAQRTTAQRKVLQMLQCLGEQISQPDCRQELIVADVSELKEAVLSPIPLVLMPRLKHSAPAFLTPHHAKHAKHKDDSNSDYEVDKEAVER